MFGTSIINSEKIAAIVSEAQLLAYYLHVYEVPCVINSPLRDDSHPSFRLYSMDGYHIRYQDYATNEWGNLYGLLQQFLGTNSYYDTCAHIWKDIPRIQAGLNCNIKESSISVKTNKQVKENKSRLECATREWRKYDLDYWASYGISSSWLEFADVHAISHSIYIKNGKRMVFPADKYAYAYVERKEGNISLKIYQPFNTKGYKWRNKNDCSVVGLWTKLPPTGDKVCICSSLKDALCLWANSGIPCVYLQGEGYNMSNTAVNELKTRFSKVYVCFDNDATGLMDGEKLSKEHDFINVVLPHFDEGKDISDYYKAKGSIEDLRQLFI